MCRGQSPRIEVALSFHRKVVGSLQGQDCDTGKSHQHSEPIQNPWLWTREEVCPQRDEEIALAIQRHTANQVAERGTEDKGQRETRGRKDEVAQLPPQRMR